MIAGIDHTFYMRDSAGWRELTLSIRRENVDLSGDTQPPESIRVGIGESPLGFLLVAESDCGLIRLGFPNTEQQIRKELDLLQNKWHPGTFVKENSIAETWAARLFGHEGRGGEAHENQTVDGRRHSVHLHLRGTPFQQSVWSALLQIPFGSTCSYRDLAESLGRPTSVRAVGTAVGRNPIALLIPCHRVIRQSGQIGDYYWGSALKQQLLARESALA